MSDQYEDKGTLPSQEKAMTNKVVYLAGIWSRILAFLIDTVIVSALFFLLVKPILYVTGYDGFTISTISLNVVLSLLTGFGYFIMMTKYFSQTLGKMIFGIKVIKLDGRPLDWGTVIFREAVGKYISQLLGLHLGYLWALFHPKKQTWHDLIAETYVVVEDEVQSRRYVHIPIHQS